MFDPRVAGSLVGHLAGAINGSSIARKTSFLKDKLRRAAVPPGIRIIDDPLRQRGLRSRPFDARGRRRRAARAGRGRRADDWLLDSATARELGLTTTGHAQRGVSSAPSPGATNLISSRARMSPDELIADIGEGFYVTDLIGMGVNR